MKSQLKHCTLKIPANIKTIYCKEKNLIIFIGALTKKSLNLQFKLRISNNTKTLMVTPIFSAIKIPNNKKKKLKSLQGTTKALIKHALIETSTFLNQQLTLIGVGYKAVMLSTLKNKIILFKLGFSHSLYFRTPKNIKIFCFKFTKLFIYGTNYQTISQLAAIIRTYKLPDPYKGKGILYKNEKINLKEGKKI